MSTQTGTIWDRTPAGFRRTIIWSLWFVTWLGLVGGLFNRAMFEYVVIWSALHALLFLMLYRFRIDAFPVQVRIAYFLWVAVGTYVPNLTVLMYITLVGLAANLFLGYCPLARMMYLMPWNRADKLTVELLTRVVLTPPGTGQFEPVSRSD